MRILPNTVLMMRYLCRYILGLASLVAVALMSVSCGGGKRGYIDFLYGSMPLPDREMYSQAWWEENVEKTLEVRKRMGWDVPQPDSSCEHRSEVLKTWRFLWLTD